MKIAPSISSASLILAFALGAGCHSHSRARRDAERRAATLAAVQNPQGPVETNQATVTGHSTGAGRGLSANDSGDDYYLSLMTEDEIGILRSRAKASGQTNFELTDFLTAQERANLRKRGASRRATAP